MQLPKRTCLAPQTACLQVIRHEVWSHLARVPRQRLRVAEVERMLASKQADTVADAP